MLDAIGLKAELDLPAYDSMDKTAALAALNNQNIEYFIEPATADFDNFLRNNGHTMKLTAVYRDHEVLMVRVAAEMALDLAASQITHVNVRNETTQQLMGLLVYHNVWTQADADAVVNFARRHRSRCEQLFGDGTTATGTDYDRAQLCDKAAEIEGLIATNSQRGAVLATMLADVQAGTDVDLGALD